MNTINNPLILTKAVKSDFDDRYWVNKNYAEGDQSGEYVDKALAEEMLEALELQYNTIFKLISGTPIRNLDEILANAKSLISKAKGE